MIDLWISLTPESRDFPHQTLNSDPVVARHSFTQAVEKPVDNLLFEVYQGAQALSAKKTAWAIR